MCNQSKSSLSKMIEDNKDYVCSIDTVVLYGLITYQLQNQEIRNAAETVQNAHSACQILISSILQMRNDRLTNNRIHEANRLLQGMCQECNYQFINNSENFINSGKPDFSLYKDGININRKGAKYLS